MENNGIPFGTPPTAFMQTGNQPVSLNQPQPVSFDDSSTTDNAFSNSTGVPAMDQSDNNLPPFGGAAPEVFKRTEIGAGQNNTTTKYAIFDMFWLINPRFYKKEQPTQNEAHIVVISFNISFGNLRISYFNLTPNAIQGNLIFLENLKRTVSGTIYPATALNAHSSTRLATTCIEQLFRQVPGASWQQERPVCVIEKNEQKIRFTIKDPKNGAYFYDFEGWQYTAFHKALEFSFTKGFELMAQQHLKN